MLSIINIFFVEISYSFFSRDLNSYGQHQNFWTHCNTIWIEFIDFGNFFMQLIQNSKYQINPKSISKIRIILPNCIKCQLQKKSQPFRIWEILSRNWKVGMFIPYSHLNSSCSQSQNRITHTNWIYQHTSIRNI